MAVDRTDGTVSCCSSGCDCGETAVGTALSGADRWNAVKCRLSNRYRMRYVIEPGLYAVGNPAADSPVLVTANYKLSFDLLRKELDGIDCRILVLDTKGINVWCAAGKGTFGTDEVISRLRAVGLSEKVTTKTLILPQLAAPGVAAHIVKRETGFTVKYGPVRASDIRRYLKNGYRKTADMRTVNFTLRDRVVLTPMEIVPALRALVISLAALFIVAGIRPEGLLFARAASAGPFFTFPFIAVLTGAFLVPVMLPYIPFRSFALKGAFIGILLTAAWTAGRLDQLSGRPFLLAAFFLLTPAASSYLALNFTGSTPFTGISGVRKELRYALPVYYVVIAGTVILVLLSVLRNLEVIS